MLAYRPQGIVLSGGPSSVYEKKAPSVSKELFEQGIPVLGICYGMQLVTHLSGGEVAKSKHREYGRAELTIDDAGDLFARASEQGGSTVVWMSHGDRIERMPPGFRSIAHTSNSPVAAMKQDDGKRRIYCLQFHPEVAHTPDGAQLLRNFVYRHLRVQTDLDDAILCGNGGRADPGTSRQRARHLRIERRRRFVGGGGAHPSGHRRPADLYLRRQRRVAGR